MWINTINPIIFKWNFIEIRYYGIFFAFGIVVAFLIALKFFKQKKYPEDDLWTLALYMIIGALVGARLGHIIFYSLDYYLANPKEIIMITHGGLSSHGATIGLIIAFWLFAKVKKIKFGQYIDVMSVPLMITAACVRLGNFFNSEIVGRETDLPWAIKFPNFEPIPVWRHPSQIYEALIALSIFVILYLFFKKLQPKLPRYSTFTLFIFLYFTSRFLVEFVKERHFFPDSFPLSMGQVLSLPFIVLAVGLGIYLIRKIRIN